MPVHDFGVALGRALLDALTPLQDWLSSVDAFERLLLRHGWRIPPEQTYFPQLKTTLALVDRIPGTLDKLDVLLATADPTLDEVTAALGEAIDLVDDLHKLASAPPPAGLPFPLNTATFWQSFPLDVVQTQIAHYIAARQQALHAVLSLFAVIDRESIPEDSGNGRSAHEEARLRWQRLKDIILDPRGLMADVYGWGAGFDHAKLLGALERAMLAFHAPVQLEIPPEEILLPYYEPTNPAFDQVRRLRTPFMSDIDAEGLAFEAGLSVLPVPPDGQKQGVPSGVFIAPYFEGQATTEVPLGACRT